MSTTTTLTAVDEDPSSSGLLSQSVSSAGSPRRHSKFSKPFKQASHFFLTRRFSDALTTIKPLITDPPSNPEDAEGKASEHVAPVASADRKWRIKIWSFYITLQNAIIELGAEDGKKAVGASEWNATLNNARNGSIWDQVVNTGYEGDETLVDAEVVLNLYVNNVSCKIAFVDLLPLGRISCSRNLLTKNGTKTTSRPISPQSRKRRLMGTALRGQNSMTQIFNRKFCEGISSRRHSVILRFSSKSLSFLRCMCCLRMRNGNMPGTSCR